MNTDAVIYALRETQKKFILGDEVYVESKPRIRRFADDLINRLRVGDVDGFWSVYDDTMDEDCDLVDLVFDQVFWRLGIETIDEIKGVLRA